MKSNRLRGGRGRNSRRDSGRQFFLPARDGKKLIRTARQDGKQNLLGERGLELPMVEKIGARPSIAYIINHLTVVFQGR